MRTLLIVVGGSCISQSAKSNGEATRRQIRVTGDDCEGCEGWRVTTNRDGSRTFWRGWFLPLTPSVESGSYQDREKL
jgi:hypothetical protein